MVERAPAGTAGPVTTEPGSTPSPVEQILRQATQAFGCDEASLLQHRRSGDLVVVASSDLAARRADQGQVRCGEGPAINVPPADVQVSADLRGDARWPRWGPAAADLGWLSVLTAPLGTPDGDLASLSLYARRTSAFDAGQVQAARFFAQYAATAWASAVEVAGLREAADARHAVGLAQGILMQRYRMTADSAFQVLRRHSQTHNVKLRAVAQHVVTTGALPPSPLAATPARRT